MDNTNNNNNHEKVILMGTTKEKVILMKTLLDLYEQNELFNNVVVQEYIDKLETKLKELL